MDLKGAKCHLRSEMMGLFTYMINLISMGLWIRDELGVIKLRDEYTLTYEIQVMNPLHR